MANFIINQDVATDTNTIEVTIDPTNPLPVGTHSFQLVVVDDSGNKSGAAVVTITVIDTTVPTAAVFATNVDGGQINTVPYGQVFLLNGTKSFDSGGGKVVKYIWTLLG
jgi:hypothetical protein